MPRGSCCPNDARGRVPRSSPPSLQDGAKVPPWLVLSFLFFLFPHSFSPKYITSAARPYFNLLLPPVLALEVYNAEIIASPSSPWRRAGMYFNKKKKKKKDQKPSKDYDFSEGSGWRGIWVTAGAGFSSSLSSVIPLTVTGGGRGRAGQSPRQHPWVLPGVRRTSLVSRVHPRKEHPLRARYSPPKIPAFEPKLFFPLLPSARCLQEWLPAPPPALCIASFLSHPPK